MNDLFEEFEAEDDVDVDGMLGVEKDAPEQLAPGFRADPRRHKVVCKHWLRGLCKRGDDCDFLHQLDKDRMPECWFFTQFGECNNKDCIFLHLRPEDKVRAPHLWLPDAPSSRGPILTIHPTCTPAPQVQECPWYARGFCKHGQRCRNRHTRKKACPRYLAGFCPDGPACQFGHAKFERPRFDDGDVCRPVGFGSVPRAAGAAANGFTRDLSGVTCYRCWQKGHYANNCPNARAAPPPGQERMIPQQNANWGTL